MDSIRVFAPATIANLGCGYDIFGLALEGIGETITIKKILGDGIVIKNQSGYPLPLDPSLNIAGIVCNLFFEKLGSKKGIEISIESKIKPGSGLGSSGSSAAGCVYAVNELFDSPFSTLELTELAMRAEGGVEGKGHADNVGAALYGGVILVRSYSPLDILKLNYPKDLWISIIYPQVEVKTTEAKKMLKEFIPLTDAVSQWGNVAGLVHGFQMNDRKIIKNSIQDVVAEPKRSLLIPCYNEMKEISFENGSFGFNISGSGPSVFSFCNDKLTCEQINTNCKNLLSKNNVEALTYISKINPIGIRILS